MRRKKEKKKKKKNVTKNDATILDKKKERKKRRASKNKHERDIKPIFMQFSNVTNLNRLAGNTNPRVGSDINKKWGLDVRLKWHVFFGTNRVFFSFLAFARNGSKGDSGQVARHRAGSA